MRAPIATALLIAATVSPLAGQSSSLPTQPCNEVSSGDGARRIVVSMYGTILDHPGASIDEDDVLVVAIPTTRKVAERIRVRRASPTRPVGLGPIAGLDWLSPETSDDVRGAAEDPKCLLVVELGDFAPGTGEVAIELVGDSKDGGLTVAQTGTFQVRVNPLYVGAFSLGPVRTTLADPSFTLATVGSDTLLVRSDADERVLYMLTYTPFLLRRRNPETTGGDVLGRLNPMLGISLDDPGRNAFAGLSVDLPAGLYLHYGLHVGRVTDLARGVVVGENGRVSGLTTVVPTSKRWVAKPFAGVTLDLRTALRFLRTATSTPAPQ